MAAFPGVLLKIMRSENKLKSIYVAVFIRLFFFLILFMIITYGIIISTLDNFAEREHTRAQVIENAINSSINDANQIMYGLTMMLAKEPINAANKDIAILLRSFDSRAPFYKSIPFSCFKLVDPNGTVVEITSVSYDAFVPKKSTTDLDLLSITEEKPSELQIGAIRLSNRFKETILPMCLGFNNINGDFAGTLCSGLLVDKLNDKLNLDCSSENITKLNVFNSADYVRDDRHMINNIFTMRNLPTLFQYFMQDKNLIAYLPLNKYSIVVEVELKLHNLVRSIVFVIFLCFNYFSIFLLFNYCLFRIYGRFYKKPFYMIQKKIYALSGDASLNYADLSMDGISKALDDIAEKQIKSTQESQYYAAMGMRSNMIDLISTKRYHEPSGKGSKVNFSSLCLTQLDNLVHEKKRVSNLHAFLNEIKDCSRKYYDKLVIDVVVQKKDDKDFTCLHAALVEVVFNIFTLIIQRKGFELDKENIILSGNFTQESLFPVINIETSLSSSSIKKSNKMPDYIDNGYTGLLGIYLLAKENNLFFHVEQRNRKVIFCLRPISDESLAKITSI